jgi:DNA-binding NarL/FixJ family response regulator
VPGCPGVHLHGNAWAFQKHNCRCPEARAHYELVMSRAAARRAARTGQPVLTRAQQRERHSQNLAAVLQLHGEGQGVRDIAERMGVHHTTVARWIRDAPQLAARAVA